MGNLSEVFSCYEGLFVDGFRSGIKEEGLDLAYFYLPTCFSSAGVFTENLFRASSVDYSAGIFKSNLVKGVVVNSGNANAATGIAGAQATQAIAAAFAEKVGLAANEVAVASTGIIGKPLPVSLILNTIDALDAKNLSCQPDRAATAILTTDLVPKIAHAAFQIGGKTASISGMTKGSGMVAPNMATVLGFLVTDLAVPNPILQSLFCEVIAETYNMVSVDNDTSTNDMVLIFSTGKIPFSGSAEDICLFRDALYLVCEDLGKKIARDGEGATKLIEVEVVGAASLDEARAIAKQVVNSPLVKTAMHGEDPNWGRIVAAACKDKQKRMYPDRLSLYIQNKLIFENGSPTDFERSALKLLLKTETIHIRLELNIGEASSKAWGCDLSHGYVDINTCYN